MYVGLNTVSKKARRKNYAQKKTRSTQEIIHEQMDNPRKDRPRCSPSPLRIRSNFVAEPAHEPHCVRWISLVRGQLGHEIEVTEILRSDVKLGHILSFISYTNYINLKQFYNVENG